MTGVKENKWVFWRNTFVVNQHSAGICLCCCLGLWRRDHGCWL